MKTASVKEIRQEIETLPQQELVKLCLRLVKFKKESKELADYILFSAHDEAAYVQDVKATLDELFTDVNIKNLYFAKKTLRKIVRIATRYIRYSEEPTTEIELLIHICTKMKNIGIDYKKSVQLQNLYAAQLKKIKKAISTMHEDLQYDYLREIQKL